MAKAKKTAVLKSVEALKHDEATRRNIPTAEYQSVMEKREQDAMRVAYERRNRDLDPQLVWRGKDEQDWSSLVVQAPPLYIQEKVHPKALVDDLLRHTKEREHDAGGVTADLFADFNGIPKGADKTEFYRHDQNWSNRMILGDSLQVMASLAEREGLRGKVQCIYFDPPYGIKFNSNFQWSTTSRDVKDGSVDQITREPEQVKAFRDTWRDGIHSYLTYLRDRLTVARDLLAETGSVFVQISDDNYHHMRELLEEIFGGSNHVASIVFRKTTGAGSPSGYVEAVPQTFDYLLWYAKCRDKLKVRHLYVPRRLEDDENFRWVEDSTGARRRLGKEEDFRDFLKSHRIFQPNPLTSQTGAPTTRFPVTLKGQEFVPGKGGWKTNKDGMRRLQESDRLIGLGKTLRFVRYHADFGYVPVIDIWDDTRQSGFGEEKVYVVQTAPKVIARCIQMTTDPGDLVLDPTCGSGTSAVVAEQWGRRWITIDTSRVALALARARIMGGRYPFYVLADSREGQQREAEAAHSVRSSQPVHGSIRHGFVYERVPHVTLKAIANNAEVDAITEKWSGPLRALLESLNALARTSWHEWNVPRDADPSWSVEARKVHEDWWQARARRQSEMDVSIGAKTETEFLYDRPYEDKGKVRVAGPFTVESLSPHRVLGVDENGDLIDGAKEGGAAYDAGQTFTQKILENLKTAGVQQAHKVDKIAFTALTPWPGDLVCAEGRYREGNTETGPEKRAAIFIGPEFGTVTRPDLVAGAREAGDADFDVLIACAFNYEAHATEFSKLGRIPVLKARMNADLHMADDLKNTGKGNLFVIFGEPDIDIVKVKGGLVQVKVNGVDVFDPSSGEVRSDGADGIACWFVDTDYNEESFFVRHAYFLGANDPYTALKTTLKAEIDQEAWETLHSDTSRPFAKPKSGRIAVKVINHLGDEVMKVFKVE